MCKTPRYYPSRCKTAAPLEALTARTTTQQGASSRMLARRKKSVRISLALATLEEWVATQESEFALLRECIKWTKIRAWIEFEKRWWYENGSVRVERPERQ